LARKILLADDSVTAQNMGRKILADAGYEVITVNNGSAALKKIAELKPDLVILDVYMPGYSGLEVCQRLKESQESARIPVLLTVGKLEPFKPEEAHRVRAEGFIVKPFEASELLAALSKLEDKVVPRAEPSKPGRFARAIAAAEEAGRISRNDSAGDDNGWKSRIGFPHEQTTEEKAADDASIYNPVNRDLRTVVETPAEKAPGKREEKKEEKHQAAETSVDVAALAPAGLPKDVTPEEVAAIAAAAAQIQIVTATIQEHPAPQTESPASVELAADRVEDRAVENVQAQPTAACAPALTAQPEVVPENVVSENLVPENIESAAGETFAAETHLRREADEKSEESQDVPMTMAAATSSMTAESMATDATAAANGSASRWSAVAVALEGEEATISLDQEMQKAYAAFVAEETASANVTALPDIAPPQNFSAPAEAAEERDRPTDAISTPEPQPSLQPPHFTSTEASEPEPPLAVQSNTAAADSFVAAEPANVPELATASIPQLEDAFVAPIAAELAPVEAQPEPSPVLAEPTHEPVAEPESAAVETAAAPQELPPAPESDPAVVEAIASSHAFAPIVHAEYAEERKEEQKEEPESETVKTTAAAWASWRQIRDTDAPKPATAEPAPQEFEAPVPAPVESAAMAAAAGADTVQETAAPPAENPTDVASIVDSVLADLRPRLMAEITRKMAEKK
jgi:two-component system chemotaxis response regulator CheY